jgi:predicted small integral membrane protein
VQQQRRTRAALAVTKLQIIGLEVARVHTTIASLLLSELVWHRIRRVPAVEPREPLLQLCGQPEAARVDHTLAAVGTAHAVLSTTGASALLLPCRLLGLVVLAIRHRKMLWSPHATARPR